MIRKTMINQNRNVYDYDRPPSAMQYKCTSEPSSTGPMSPVNCWLLLSVMNIFLGGTEWMKNIYIFIIIWKFHSKRKSIKYKSQRNQSKKTQNSMKMFSQKKSKNY